MGSPAGVRVEPSDLARGGRPRTQVTQVVALVVRLVRVTLTRESEVVRVLRAALMSMSMIMSCARAQASRNVFSFTLLREKTRRIPPSCTQLAGAAARHAAYSAAGSA